MKTEDWSDAFISLEVLKIAGKPPEARKRQSRAALKVSEGTWSCGHHDFRSVVSRTGKP